MPNEPTVDQDDQVGDLPVFKSPRTMPVDELPPNTTKSDVDEYWNQNTTPEVDPTNPEPAPPSTASIPPSPSAPEKPKKRSRFLSPGSTDAWSPEAAQATATMVHNATVLLGKVANRRTAHPSRYLFTAAEASAIANSCGNIVGRRVPTDAINDDAQDALIIAATMFGYTMRQIMDVSPADVEQHARRTDLENGDAYASDDDIEPPPTGSPLENDWTADIG